MKQLYKWQKEALNALRINSYCGIVVAVTGSGKTRIATNVIKDLRVRTLIVVPTVALMHQWRSELLEVGIKDEDIGFYYSNVKVLNKVTIAVINSVYDMVGLSERFKLLILDEVHRLGAEMWCRLLLNNNFKYNIGLTATLERHDGAEKLLKRKVGRVVYEYKTRDAVKDDLLNSFSIVNVAIDLPIKEKDYLARLDAEIKSGMESFSGDMLKVVAALKRGNKYAANVLRVINKRKRFYNNSLPKVERAVQIILENRDKKIIVFNEYIETADKVFYQLQKHGITPYVYYSGNLDSLFKFTPNEKNTMLDTFRKASCGVLITVKALDEGLNVPDLEVGVILGYNKTSRQAIQRMGRLLRKVDDKAPVMYNLYYNDTSDVFNAQSFGNNFSDVARVYWR